MVVHQQQQRKGRWMTEEDRLLNRLVCAHGDGDDIDWSVLEQSFNGTRDSKQIRERWVNHLNPSIKKRKFNDDEISIIEEECSKHKFKWAKIAKKIPNATPLMIKNFYNNRLKKKNPANNRRLSNANTITTSITTTTYSINDFNNITTNNNNFNLNNNNHKYNCYNNEYRPVQDINYYNESDLSRENSVRTSCTPSLSRNSSIKTTSSSLSTMPESPLSQNNFCQTSLTSSSPRQSSELGDHYSSKDNLILLAKTADFVSTVEHFPTDNLPKPKKAKKMSLSTILNF